MGRTFGRATGEVTSSGIVYLMLDDGYFIWYDISILEASPFLECQLSFQPNVGWIREVVQKGGLGLLKKAQR